VSSAGEHYPYHPPTPPIGPDEPYEIAIRSQAGGEELLERLGALAEVRKALLGHCEASRPLPAYRPQLVKDRLIPHDWVPEARVPPFRPKLDDRAINERYDMLKFFERNGREVGVAIEMNDWKVHRDLLKFRRGLERGQIVAGIVIQPNYRETYYCFEHFRHLNEPLFGHIPVVYCCPRGPGLTEPLVRRTKAKPFPMPSS
jgi:hypothetical protein